MKIEYQVKRMQHVGKGYLAIWKSAEMQSAVDEAGSKVARNANAGYSGEYFGYYPKPGRSTAMGFVSSTGPSGAYYQQKDKALSKAVRP